MTHSGEHVVAALKHLVGQRPLIDDRLVGRGSLESEEASQRQAVFDPLVFEHTVRLGSLMREPVVVGAALARPGGPIRRRDRSVGSRVCLRASGREHPIRSLASPADDMVGTFYQEQFLSSRRPPRLAEPAALRHFSREAREQPKRNEEPDGTADAFAKGRRRLRLNSDRRA